MWGIWALTLLISVFFSYTALFNTVYSVEERKSNRIVNSITLGSKILGEIENSLIKEVKTKKLKTNLNNYNLWKQNVRKTLKNAIKDSQNELIRLEQEYKTLKNKYQHELDYGGTEYINSQGKKAFTTAGSGKISDAYKLDATNFKKNKLNVYKEKIKIFHLKEEEILKNIADFESSQDISYFNIAYEKFIKLINNMDMHYSIKKSVLGESFNNLIEVEKNLKQFSKVCSSDILKDISFQENLNAIRRCIRVSKISEMEVEKHLKSLKKIEKRQGIHTHFFIVVINELIEANPLSFATLGLAFIIDILILLCSLVASKHTTFLNMKEPKDLLQMKNYPLEIILDADTDIHSSDTMFIKRIKLILSNAYFDLTYAKKGYSMVIEKDKILDLNMHKELGTFFSMGLAKPVEEGKKIAFKTNFILWMCEQISRQYESNSSSEEMKKAFKGKEYE